jgi:hypothetical protein
MPKEDADTSNEYALSGTPKFPQVSPDASYWLRCPILASLDLDEIRKKLDSKVPQYPADDSRQAQGELQELRDRFAQGEDPDAFDQRQLSIFLTDPIYVLPPPVGAVLNRRRQQGNPIIRNGAELARLFENETPGLWHDHVLDNLLAPNAEAGMKLSPPRQALVRSALHVAILSALSAIWHYKWLATGLDQVARRHRPVEVDTELGVLFDFKVIYDRNGNIRRGAKKTQPQPSPGTPRHPAYGSGHSTYSAAASYVLGCFFPDLRPEFEKLANNIGEARLWGGVHWRTDHDAGQLVGATIGRMVIEQLNQSGIKRCPEVKTIPPARGELEKEAIKFESPCGGGKEDFCRGVTCPDTAADESFQNLLGE